MTYFRLGIRLEIVKRKKSVLIVTDGTEKVKKMAENIAAALKGNKILLKDSSSFSGTDLLPAEILFFGCEKPSPPSFDYFETLLQHINLAGRPLGIFSPNSKEALKYLSRIVKDSEAALYSEAFITENARGIEEWTTRIIAAKK